MKRISVITTMLIFGIDAIAGTVFINPLSVHDKSIDNGGVKSAIDAYKDGVGVIVLDNLGLNTQVDNSAMNTLVYKYGETAKINNTTIANQILNLPNVLTPTIVDIKLAQSLVHADGTLCDDGSPSTHGETWLNDVCQSGIPNVYVNGSICDDGNPATIGEIWLNDVCQGGTIVTFTNGTACDDGNSLTTNDIYTNGICAGTLISTADNTCAGGYQGDYVGSILCHSKGLTVLSSGWLNLTSDTLGLTLNNNNLTDISALGNVRYIGGNSFNLLVNKLTSLHGLENLETTKSFSASSNPNLTDISALSKLYYVNDISFNETGLTNLHGLENLVSDVSNPVLNISVSYSHLTNVDALTNIRVISNRITLNDNALTSIYGLRNLTSIYDMLLYNNPTLMDISPLNSVNNVTAKIYFDARNYTGKLEATSYLCVNFSTKIGMRNNGVIVAAVKSYVCK